MIILIADDDKNIRFTIKSMLLDILDEEETSFFEAQDGLELISLCSTTPIDVAFVDIKMPNMTGLDAIQKVREFNSDISFIILTCYSDFKYAKRAITLGITDYLLKPVDSEALQDLIKLVEKENIKHIDFKKSHLQAQVFNIVSYLSVLGDKFDFHETPLPKGFVYLVMDFLFFYPTGFKDLKAPFKYTTLANIPQFLAHILPPKTLSCHLRSSENNVQCLVQIEEQNEQAIVNEIEKNILHIEAFPGVKVVVLYNKCVSLVDAVKKGEENLTCQYLALNQKGYTCKKYYKVDDKIALYLSLLWNIREIFANNDSIAYIEEVENFAKNFTGIPTGIKIKYVLESLSVLVGDCKITTQSEFVTVLRGAKILTPENTHDITEKIKKYVEINYMKNFGINQIAGQLGVTPNYLGSLFHKITGIYFIDYLNSYRLEKAKKVLLANSSVSIKDIAMMVGYSNARYFSSLFKQSFNILPSAYRKQYLEK